MAAAPPPTSEADPDSNSWLSRRGLRAGMKRWRNGLAVASVIWWHDRPLWAFPRMRSDARGFHDGQEHKRSVQGPDTEAQDLSPPNHHFPLATRGRSIQKCHKQTSARLKIA